MSRIFTEWKTECKCENCGHKAREYISFGHPDGDFDFKWKCEKCEHINVLHVRAVII